MDVSFDEKGVTMDEQAFVDEILAEPESDDALRVYADWLEDHGHADRARLIRVDLERDSLPRGDAKRDEELRQEYNALRERVLKALPVSASLRKKLTFRWNRGLLYAQMYDDRQLTPADFRALSGLGALKTLSGFEHLTADQLANLSLVPSLRRLEVGESRSLTEEDWQALVGLTHVERLILESRQITDDDLRRLSAMTQLKELDLN